MAGDRLAVCKQEQLKTFARLVSISLNFLYLKSLSANVDIRPFLLKMWQTGYSCSVTCTFALIVVFLRIIVLEQTADQQRVE